MIGIAAGATLALAAGFAAGYAIGRNSSDADEAAAGITINELRGQIEKYYKAAYDRERELKELQGNHRYVLLSNDLNREEIMRLEALRDSMQDQIKQLEADAYIKAENAHHRASEASKKGWETRKAKKVEVAA